MNELGRKLTKAQDVSSNVARLYQERLKAAQERFSEHRGTALNADVHPPTGLTKSAVGRRLSNMRMRLEV